jgi:hypothetical protein
MLETLSADVFPYYSSLAKYSRLAEVEIGFDRPKPVKMSSWAALPANSELKPALSLWADSFHADVDWVMDEALRILEGWHVNPGWRETLEWRPVRAWLVTIPTEDFEFQGWVPEIETWLAYSDRFKKEFLEYEKHTRTRAESHGLVRARRQYSPENFNWFVLRQFAGESSGTIARNLSQHLDPVTVRKGIRTAAKLLQWKHLRAPQHKPPGKTQ